MKPKLVTIDEFITHFEEIPEEYFTVSSVNNPTDVWEWIENDIAAEWRLFQLVAPYGILLAANDGIGPYKILGTEPKKRVLLFLGYVKRQLRLKEEKRAKKNL
jgi:hypothetical protein